MENRVCEEIRSLVEEYRDRCLRFLQPDYTPCTAEEALRTLDLIERYGDRAAFERAEALKQWLLPNSKPESLLRRWCRLRPPFRHRKRRRSVRV